MTSKITNENKLDLQRLKLARESFVTRDYTTAMRECSALAEKGNAHAWSYLGLLHQKGLGVPQSSSEAEVCYDHAIALGSVDALFSLGRLHYDSGAAEKAFDCFQKAASRGNLPGIYWTGRAYLLGHGTRKDIEKAKVYLTTATDRGHVYARMDYRVAQIKGIFGPVQRIAGVFGLFKAFVVMIKTLHSDPSGNRVR